MNREQQKVLELLKEIDTICRKNKITYYLSPYLTLCAVTERPFPMNPASNDIYMKTGDMARFKNIFDEEPELRRALESMENNSRFPGFFLRYTDKDTLFYKLDEYGKYKHPGLGINILPLQCEYGPKGKYLWNRMREEGWKRIYGKKGKWRNRRELGCIWMVRVLSLCGRGWLAKSIFRDLLRQPQDGAKTYVLRYFDQNLYFPAHIFENPGEAMLGGESFMVPGNTDSYLTRAYGKNYRNKSMENYVPGSLVVCSTLIPCEEFLQQSKELKKFASVRKKREKRRQFGMNYREYLAQCWDYAKFCGEKYTCALAYRKKLSYIRNLFKNEDYVELEKAFARYTRMNDRCLKYEEAFETDPEVFDLYLKYLEKTGRISYMEKVKKYV